MPDQDWTRDRGQVEHPFHAQRERVIDPAVRAMPECFGIGVGQQPLDGHLIHDPAVGAGELRAEFLQQQLGIVTDQLAAFGQDLGDRARIGVSPPVLGGVRCRHALIPIQAGGVRRRHPDQCGNALHPLAEPLGAREGVRCATGAAHYAEPVDAQSIGDHPYVCRRVGDTATGVTIRTAIARPVVADEPDAEPVENARARPRPAPASGGAVQEEDRNPVLGSDAVHSEVTPVRSGYRLCHSGLPRVSLIHQRHGPPS